MLELNYYDLERDLDLNDGPWVAVQWAGLNADTGRKEKWCRKGQIIGLPSRTTATVALEGGGVLTAKISELTLWSDSKANRVQVR